MKQVLVLLVGGNYVGFGRAVLKIGVPGGRNSHLSVSNDDHNLVTITFCIDLWDRPSGLTVGINCLDRPSGMPKSRIRSSLLQILSRICETTACLAGWQTLL